MKNILSLLTLLSVLFFAACSKYQTQYEGPYSEDGEPKAIAVNYQILTILDGKITLFDQGLKHRKEVAGTPSDVTEASISFDHQLIAYKRSGQNIQVIDTTGKFIAEVAGSATGYAFDWHANNQTLYYLKNNKIYFYGPALQVPISDLDMLLAAGASSDAISGLAITANNNVWVCYEYYTFQTGDTRFVEGRSPSGQIMKKTIGSYLSSSWMRTDLSGQTVYFDTYSNFSQNVYGVNTNAKVLTDVGEYKYLAFNPEGDYKVFSDGSVISTVLPSGNFTSVDLNGAQLTALDW